MSLPSGGYVVTTIAPGTIVTVSGQENDSYVLEINDTTYTYVPKKDFLEGINYATGENIVDLRSILPDAIFHMDWTMDNNITGRGLYPPIPLLQTDTAMCLMKAAEQFRQDGYGLVIHDAYRPSSAQFAIWEIIKDKNFVVDPYTSTSWHNVGKAVDVSLYDLRTGQELEMPCDVYDFGIKASRLSDALWSGAAQENAYYLAYVMQSAGFGIIESEWWHFEYTDKEAPSMNRMLNYAELDYEPAS